ALFASTPEQIWKQAVSLHQSGQYEAAAEQYQQLLQANANFVPALSNLGAVYSKMGRYDDAATQYRKALELQPDHTGIRLNLGLALYQQARLSEASVEFEKLLAAGSSNAQARHLLADCLLRMGKNTNTIELLKDEESSDNRAVAYILGTALIRDGQVTRGQRIIDRLFRDESAESLMLLGAAQIAAQDNKQALATLTRALALKPALPELNSLYGVARLTDGDPNGAKKSFLAELEHNPHDFEANLQLGALLRVDKEYERAAEYLGRARQVRPQSLPLKYQLASLELSTGDVTRAIAMLEEVTREAPDFVEGHITLATAYYRAKRKADGDRERATVDRLNAEHQARELKK
ncbi:MAG TPA: tetratricopeptide repeat protein, partial [Bryobacteraceae bacterium]|nr:tetratricopeptide repeat protein [Bryobacteraceae bacterium]